MFCDVTYDLSQLIFYINLKIKVYSVLVGWRVLYIILFRSFISLLIFCLLVSITKRGVLNSPSLTVDFSVSPFSSVRFCFCVLKLYCWLYTHLGLLCLLVNRTFCHYVIALFMSGNCPSSESTFPVIIIATSVLFISIFMV